MTDAERLEKLENTVTELEVQLTTVRINQARNLGLLAGGFAVLTAIGGWLAIGKLLLE